MADDKKDTESGFDTDLPEPADIQPTDITEPLEAETDPHAPDAESSGAPDVNKVGDTVFIIHTIEDDVFEAPDVSEPRTPRKEADIIEEERAMRRREWIRSHLIYIYAVIGVIFVGLMVLIIHIYFQSTNPVSRFVSSVSKDFGTSFAYDIRMTENDETVMSYSGAIKADRGSHGLQSLYEADYNSYSFTGALYADDALAAAGSFYNDKWSVHDCTDRIQDFFEFDRSFRTGGFNGGAFLRFTGLTSTYSTDELERFADVLKNRLSTDSPIAVVSSVPADSGTRYRYHIDLYELFSMVQKDGASVFYRASDYDKFSEMFEMNKSVLKEAECTADFAVDPAGYMTLFEASVTVQDVTYGLSCTMSDFGSAEVEIPEDFMKAAAANAAQE